MVKDGKAYFHQFNSREGAWEYAIAPDKYQQIDEVIRKWGNPNDEVAPTERVVLHRVVGNEVVPEVAYWQLVPPWIEARPSIVTTRSGQPRLRPPPRTHFNSRQDTLTGSPAWRRMLQRNRGVVFASSFLEWSDEEMLQGRQKLVGRFSLADGKLMALAAIWSTVTTSDGDHAQTCSIVTTAPNSLLEGLPHHRMPAILQGDDLFRWLDPLTERPECLLHPTSTEEIEAVILPAREYARLLPPTRV